MEQKKVLWVLLSVTVFLFVVSITGIFWFYPSRNQTADAGAPDGKSGQAAVDFDPVEWVRQGEDFPGMVEKSEDGSGEGFSIVYGETGDGGPVLDLVEDQPADKVAEKSAQTDKPEPPETVSKPVNTVETSVTEKPAAVAEPAPRTVNVLEYWIQAGSFTSRSRAEDASDTLSEKGLASLITIKTVDGDDYYRVRMGPYSNKEEAEKFLKWVKEINSYENSYISQVYVRKTVN